MGSGHNIEVVAKGLINDLLALILQKKLYLPGGVRPAWVLQCIPNGFRTFPNRVAYACTCTIAVARPFLKQNSHLLATSCKGGPEIPWTEAVTLLRKRDLHAQAELDRFMEYPKAAESMAEELDK